MTNQLAWTKGSEWAQLNPSCTREEYEQRVAAFTNAWGPNLGGRFRAAVLNALRVIRRG